MKISSKLIKSKALDLGFHKIGIAKAVSTPNEREKLIASGDRYGTLSTHDMQQAHKFEGSLQRAIDSGSAKKKEGSGLFGTNFLASYEREEDDKNTTSGGNKTTTTQR